MNHLLAFFIIVFYVLGTIGGVCFALYRDSWPVALAIVILGVLAFPKFKEAWQELNGVIKSKFKEQ